MDDQSEVTYTLQKGQRYLTEIFDPPMLPCGIVRKGATGIGATKMELFDSPRNVIMVSPLLSILASKKHEKVLTISGEVTNKLQAVTEYINFCQSTNQQYLKIHTSAVDN
jgi:hypothetical protein